MTPAPETAALYGQILSGELTAWPGASSSTGRSIPSIVLKIEPSSLLVGRQSEFERLRNWLDTAQRGRGQTLLITGDAGIGKTLLAGELLCAAAGSGMTVLFGAAYEQEGQLAYQPFIEAFDRYLAEHQRSPAENPITAFKPRGSSDPQQEQWALFNAAAVFLAGLALRNPVALLVDDLHAADEASLRLFHYLARQTRAAPVVLLATCRSDLGDTIATPLSALLTTLYRERLSETLPLAPLTEGDAASIMAHTLGGGAVPELVKAVFEITGGNPFFVEEMSRALLKSGQAEEQAGQWRLRPGATLDISADLAGLLRERTRRLGSAVEVALSAAAVVGREFGFDVLRGVAELPDGVVKRQLEILSSDN